MESNAANWKRWVASLSSGLGSRTRTRHVSEHAVLTDEPGGCSVRHSLDASAKTSGKTVSDRHKRLPPGTVTDEGTTGRPADECAYTGAEWSR